MSDFTTLVRLLPWALYAGTVAALAVALNVVIDQRDDARAATISERAAHDATIERFRLTQVAAAARAERDAAATALAQASTTQEIANAYQARLDDLNRRITAVRLSNAASGAGRGDRGRSPAPALSDAAGRTDAAAAQAGLSASCPAGDPMSLEDRIIASEQALQLLGLQEWIIAQQRLAATEPAQ